MKQVRENELQYDEVTGEGNKRLCVVGGRTLLDDWTSADPKVFKKINHVDNVLTDRTFYE